MIQIPITAATGQHNHHHHHRNTSSTTVVHHKRRHSKELRLQRPAPMTRRDTGGRRSPHQSHRSNHARAEEVADEMVAGSFQQYCATCEKEISVSNASVLYCSEKCRSQDTSAHRPYALFRKDVATPPMSPRVEASRWSPAEELSTVDIIPQRSPTVHTPSTFFHRISSYEDMDAFTSTSPPAGRQTPPRRHRSRPSLDRSSDSEAFRYLSQFHSMPFESSMRGRYSRNGSTANGMTAPPSLSHTPSSSSVSASAGSASYFDRRPLPPQRSSMHFTSNRSVELVTPLIDDFAHVTLSSSSHASDDTLVPAMDAYTHGKARGSSSPDGSGLSYEKKSPRMLAAAALASSSGAASSRLKQMFEGEELRGRVR